MISDTVSKCVIDSPEVVEIHIEQRNSAVLSSCHADRLIEAFAKCPAIRKPGQTVVAREMTELILIEALLGRPIRDLLDELSLDQEITSAIVDREGDLGALLQIVIGIEQGDFDVVSELAGLLALHDQKREARLLLDGLAERSRGERLRRLRMARLRLSPTPANLWRWITETLRSPGERLHGAAVAPVRRPAVVPLRAARRA